MDFVDLVKQRKSCREYEATRVERDKLVSIIETAKLSPSACNSQPWRFVIVDDVEKVSQIAPMLQNTDKNDNKFTNKDINKFVYNVPAFIVVCETKAVIMPNVSMKMGSQYYAQIDIGIVTANTVFSATNLGLSTCIIGSFHEEQLKELLSIPEKIKIRLVVCVGYEKEKPMVEKKRKPFDKIANFNQW